MVVDVDPGMKVDDVLALITVQNSEIDFDKATLYYQGKVMPLDRKLNEFQIKDGYSLQLRIRDKTGCCTIF
jgi:hypothetical protein